jgi:hypothetical protein
LSQLNTQHKATPITLTQSLCASTKILFETQHLLKILFLYHATSKSLLILSAQCHDIINIPVDSFVTFVRDLCFRVAGTNIGVSGCDALWFGRKVSSSRGTLMPPSLGKEITLYREMATWGSDNSNYGWKWTCETPFSSVFSALAFVLTQIVSFIPNRL